MNVEITITEEDLRTAPTRCTSSGPVGRAFNRVLKPGTYFVTVNQSGIRIWTGRSTLIAGAEKRLVPVASVPAGTDDFTVGALTRAVLTPRELFYAMIVAFDHSGDSRDDVVQDYAGTVFTFDLPAECVA